MTDDEILKGVLDEFRPLARIPRPSGHEKAVSDYLKETFTKLGAEVVQDETNNIIADLPASKGYEHAPRTLLQSHMDMVCVAETGKKYDPLNDAIELVETDEFLSANGTSLGSDDGTGIAEIIYTFKNAVNHGPLRAIITVDEEVGMTGARNLDAKYLDGVDYYINCDSEDDDLLTIGSAGSVGVDFHRHITWRDKSSVFADEREANAYEIKIAGLLGGHSGERIADGRGNAIRVLALIIDGLKAANVDFAVAEICGGTARNAIPSSATLIIVTCAPKSDIQAVLDEVKSNFLASYGDVDENIELSLNDAERHAKVMSDDDVASFAELVMVLHTGVFSMFAKNPKLVETSANIGMARTDGDDVWFTYFIRSGIYPKLMSLLRECMILGKRFSCEARAAKPSPVWQANTKSKLAKMMTDVYHEQCGKVMRVEAIHAGLECSYMLEKNPKLDAVSIGVTTLDIHSPNEHLVKSTVAPQVKLIMGTLAKIAGLRKE